MGLLRTVVHAIALDRLSRHRGPRPYDTRGQWGQGQWGQGGHGQWGGAPWAGPVRRPARRGRFSLLPIPRYSSTTRRGTRVSVGGCCLPIPFAMAVTTVAAVVLRHRSAAS